MRIPFVTVEGWPGYHDSEAIERIVKRVKVIGCVSPDAIEDYEFVKKNCKELYLGALKMSNGAGGRKKWNNFLNFMYNYFDEIKEAGYIRPLPIFDDGINYTVPNKSGLYFVGETHFNPYTREEFYWVKIGKATNIKNRMNQYNTHCPMLWRIDFKLIPDCYLQQIENDYHQKLKNVANSCCNHNDEWFLVDRDVYLEMCDKGFSYFN